MHDRIKNSSLRSSLKNNGNFLQCPEERNPDLAQSYRMYFSRNVNPVNLAMFIDSYVRRVELGISRDTTTLTVPVLNITGALSPHVDDTVTFNGRLNPYNSTWMKVSTPSFNLALLIWYLPK